MKTYRKGDAIGIMLSGLGAVDDVGWTDLRGRGVIDDLGGRGNVGDGAGPGPFVPGPTPKTPGAVPVYPEAWDTSTDPAHYTIQAGDTLVGLAATYLGDGARWREIWDYQSADTRARNSPDRITTTRRLRMPPEATANYLVWVDRGRPANVKPGETKPSTVDKIATSVPGGKKTLYLLGGLGALGALYALSR